jgi:tetratricopeptide (TPR) repeat protein
MKAMKYLIPIVLIFINQFIYAQNNTNRKPITIDGSEFESLEVSKIKAEKQIQIQDSIHKVITDSIELADAKLMLIETEKAIRISDSLNKAEAQDYEVIELDPIEIDTIEMRILYDGENTSIELSKEEIWQKADSKMSHINRTSEDYIKMAKSCSKTREGDYLAVYFYTKAIAKNNNCFDCYLGRGKREINYDNKSTLDDYKMALKINPKCFDCYKELGYLYCWKETNRNYPLARKNYYKALKGLECIEKDFEEQRFLIHEIGMTYFLELEKKPKHDAWKKYRTVRISIWDSLIKINPMSDYYLERAELKKSEFVKDYNGAISDYKHVYNKGESNNYDIIRSLANCYFKLLNYFESLKYFNMAIEIIEKQETNSFTIETLASLYAGKSECKMNLKDYRGAIEDNQIAISYHLKKSDKNTLHLLLLYTELGKARIHLNDYKNAIVDLNEAIKYDDKWTSYTNGEVVTYQDLAYAYYLLGAAHYKLYENSSIYGFKDDACKAWSKAGDLGNKEAYTYIKDYCNN